MNVVYTKEIYLLLIKYKKTDPREGKRSVFYYYLLLSFFKRENL